MISGGISVSGVDRYDAVSQVQEEDGVGTNEGSTQMVKYLYRRCADARWLESSPDLFEDTETSNLSVMVRRPEGLYTAEPMFLNPELLRVIERLRAPVAITMSSHLTNVLIQQLPPLTTEVPLDPYGSMLPVVGSVSELPGAHCPKDAYLCLCRQENFVLIWSNSVSAILAHAADIETRLMGVVWGSPISNPTTRMSMSQRQSYIPTPAAPASESSTPNRHTYIPAGSSGYSTPWDEKTNEKLDIIHAAVEQEEQGDKGFDIEKEGAFPPKRPFLLSHSLIIGLAIILAIVVEMACVAKLVKEARLDGKYLRFAMIATIPAFGAFSLFFCVVIMGSIFQLFGPLGNLTTNSTFYSAKAPKPGRYPNLELPHITIQLPVYKEGLKGVIIPTVTSVMAAVKHYEECGGTASIYVNDDGMQIVKPELAEARRAFYDLNRIAYCARPPHCTDEGDQFFLRRGQFKKASNMNYCLGFSLRVEDELMSLVEQVCHERGCTHEDLTVEEETELQEVAMNKVLEHDGGRTWAAGEVRIGEIVLIIDSDTRVPEDCLVYGALEMHESPEVALIQHASGILQVVNNVFENGITYFTNLIYTQIQFAVGSGDCAPFVGHNTFLRWKALQSIAFEQEGQVKFWSEEHVSEDFDVSLRLQMNDFIVRLATYHEGGFKEGVSLTVYDELARWEKYAYGCNELVFNPILKWPIRGPFTRLFLRFLFSKIKVTSKVTIIGYIFTYYAIASAVPLVLCNYLIIGWMASSVDQFYLTSWKIFVGMAVVFNVLSPLAFAMLRHRLGQSTFFMSLWETIKWTPMFLLFFGGLSLHLLKAICCHFFSIRMEWTTTAKELEASGFRVGLDRVVRDFKFMYAFVVPVTGGMIYLATSAPDGWTIKDFAAIVPLANQIGCHALLPVNYPPD
ncbi:hypothetical protein UCRPC4_g05575 [Phaeomoniella chlamydospora]|uniref:Uncharacterized protein n=1 Tax=Phaeomoniella chlamydospora TaxID=158046 RepID=A0A0G2G0F2_PHACM|nr:hypothetical protein UCRPC4_g05575 [Phaeomoniella chlamydospora]